VPAKIIETSGLWMNKAQQSDANQKRAPADNDRRRR
jgi:hypothetical protein